MQYASVIDANKNKIFRYLSFDKMPSYQEAAVKGAEKARLPILQ
ncbi:MAG: hypothetical protein ACK5U8_22780 [Deltaproteobacteria bacterium]|jgi:hypothetical protein